jgi:polyisoprenoid-binding protein YceI/cytochrome c551/c552
MRDTSAMTALRRLDLGRLALLVLVVVATAAMLTKDRWDWIVGSDEAETQGVDAPVLEVDDDGRETWLFRVSPDNGSEVRYVVTERLAGSEKTTVGASAVIGGDILVDVNDPSRSTVGEIVVNVEMFNSDSTLRDKRLRHDFLESTHWPFARFVTTEIAGLPDQLIEGAQINTAFTGELTVKDITRVVTFEGTVSVTKDAVVASVAATVLGSDFGVGPINIARLAHTDDRIRLEFDLVAERVKDGSDAETDLSREVPADQVSGGAFAEHVQPILEQRCVSCHTIDGPGWSTLALDTAGDAAVIAEDIALVTGAGYMPPWLPSDLSVDFHNDWSLSVDELATLANWAAEGGGLDVSPDTSLVARSQLITPIRRDQVLVPESYTGSLDQPDDYRCLVYEVDDLDGDGNWITGFAFEPDQTAVVHHAIVYRVPAAARAEVDAKDGADGEPGWTCFGRSGLRSQGVYAIAGWAPGQEPGIYPPGVGIQLKSGDMIVNQIHYHYDHETPADASVIVLQTASDEEVSAGMRAIQRASYLTPAEVPCTPEEQGPLCDRDAVLAEIGQKYGFEATMIPGLLLSQCGGSVDDYDDLDGSIGASSCDLKARNEGTIFSVLGHMHEFGAAYRMTLNPDTPGEVVLLDIPTWSFEWQLNYRPVDDIRIDTDDVVRFECWWDRTLVHMAEPRYITWNEGTVDEMCFSSIWVLPDPSP